MTGGGGGRNMRHRGQGGKQRRGRSTTEAGLVEEISG